MSLLRLLTAGKSLIGGNQSGTRYRDAGQGMLPKFASKKNPFRATAKAGASARLVSTYEGERENAPASDGLTAPMGVEDVGAAREIQTSPVSPNEGEREKPVERQKEKESTSASGGRLPQAAARVERSGAGWIRLSGAELKGWLLSVPSAVSKSWFVGRRSSAKPVVQRVSKPLVQGELSLDRIKVIRNDLSDSDLEVVPARPLVVAGPSEILGQSATPALPPACLAQRAEGSSWTRVSARFFGAGKL